MKFLLRTLTALIIIYFTLKFALYFLNKGHDISYNIGNFNIKETLKVKDNNNYYFKIKHEDFQMTFQINKDYKKAKKVISDIKYENIDGYQCVLPIFKKEKIQTDIMCLKDDTITYAHDLNTKNIGNFQDKMQKYGYNKQDYIDKENKINLSNTQTLYKDNLIQNNYIAMESYKGLNLFNNDTSTVKIFENDVYKKPISYFYKKYYIVADYESEYTFKYFYIINIINGKKTQIRSYDEISFDAYIEGAVGDDIYLFDKDAQTQYKISLKYETVEKFAGKDNLKYYNGQWQSMTLKEAIDGKKFENYHTEKIKGYDKVDKVDNYYYLYQKEENTYKVYRTDIKNPKQKTYLFTTTNKDTVIYQKNAVYYQNSIDFCYYSKMGNRKIISNTELNFNEDISFGAYEKEWQIIPFF